MTSRAFSDLVELCNSLEVTAKRKEKIKLLAEFLRSLEPEEVSPAVLMIVGSIFPEFDSRVLEVGWRTVKQAIERRTQTTLFKESLSIKKVHDTLRKIAESEGPGSRKFKTTLLEGLMSSADSRESDILVRIIFREMRIGVNEGMMLEGISKAAKLEIALVRRALMLTGNLGRVAEIALNTGEEGLKLVKMSLFTPLKPMLASMSYDISEVLEEHGGKSAFEYKLDGARIQIHRSNDFINIFSRRLSNVTESLPDIIDIVRTMVKSNDIVLEGEVVAIGEGNKPLPFQDLMRRFRRIRNVNAMTKKIPLQLHLFDLLYLDGTLLIDDAYKKRRALLEMISPPELLVKRVVTSDAKKVQAFLKEALEAGHEGLMSKHLDSIYTPGSRGKKWFKIKPVETLDLIIVAADWGYGRRKGWLSNYHLAARDENEYKVIGKTFKGLTDEEFIWITKRLQELKIRETSGTVYVQPELVVEVAFNEIQRSSKYLSGFALRFARITRIREDKRKEETDSLDRVQELFEAQFKYKAKAEF